MMWPISPATTLICAVMVPEQRRAGQGRVGSSHQESRSVTCRPRHPTPLPRGTQPLKIPPTPPQGVWNSAESSVHQFGITLNLQSNRFEGALNLTNCAYVSRVYAQVCVWGGVSSRSGVGPGLRVRYTMFWPTCRSPGQCGFDRVSRMGKPNNCNTTYRLYGSNM